MIQSLVWVVLWINKGYPRKETRWHLCTITTTSRCYYWGRTGDTDPSDVEQCEHPKVVLRGAQGRIWYWKANHTAQTPFPKHMTGRYACKGRQFTKFYLELSFLYLSYSPTYSSPLLTALSTSIGFCKPAEWTSFLLLKVTITGS